MTDIETANRLLSVLVDGDEAYSIKEGHWIHHKDYKDPIAYCDADKLLHTLHMCSVLKRGKVTPEYIHEVASWLSMCVSLVTYGHDWHKYKGDKRIYRLSDIRKSKVYGYVQAIVENIRYAGGGYYSCDIKPFVTPDKG